MFHSRVLRRVIIAGGCLWFLAGCYQNKTVPLEVAEVRRAVSFSQDIIPILNKSCNTSGCHNTGGQAPNLSASSAYNSLVIGNYVDKNAAATSILYLKMTGKRGIPMPVSGTNKEYNALVYAWIKQGASNN